MIEYFCISQWQHTKSIGIEEEEVAELEEI